MTQKLTFISSVFFCASLKKTPRHILFLRQKTFTKTKKIYFRCAFSYFFTKKSLKSRNVTNNFLIVLYLILPKIPPVKFTSEKKLSENKKKILQIFLNPIFRKIWFWTILPKQKESCKWLRHYNLFAPTKFPENFFPHR